MADRRVNIWISLKNMKGAASSVRRLGGTFTRLGKRAAGAFRGIGRSILSLKGLIMGALVYGAFRAFTRIVGDLTRTYGVQEQADVDLASALRTTGQGTAETAAEMKTFAAEMQAATIYGDEFVQGLMVQGLNLGVSSGQLKQVTVDALGLSKALKMDLNTSMRYVALAYQGEMTMLRRYIPLLRQTEDQTEQLAIVQKTAAAGFEQLKDQTRTSGGLIEQLSNVWGDLKETVGSFIAQSPVVLGFFAGLKARLQGADKWLERHRDDIQALADQGFVWLAQKAEAALEVIQNLAEDGSLRRFAADAKQVASDVGNSIGLLVNAGVASYNTFLSLGQLGAAAVTGDETFRKDAEESFMRGAKAYSAARMNADELTGRADIVRQRLSQQIGEATAGVGLARPEAKGPEPKQMDWEGLGLTQPEPEQGPEPGGQNITVKPTVNVTGGLSREEAEDIAQKHSKAMAAELLDATLREQSQAANRGRLALEAG